MYDTVLVPTDGSDRTLEALEHANSLAERYGAVLHTLYVVQTTGVTEALDGDQFEAVIERVEHAGEQAVERVVERAHESGITDVESTVTHGIPAETILEYVEDHDVDVVVMATTGRTGAERDVVGSVTERVVRSSPIPVLTVNTGE